MNEGDMRAGVAAVLIMMLSLPGHARAQSSTDAALAISLHPDVPTILQLPDTIERAQIYDRGEFRVVGIGNELHIQPLPSTPAGVEGLLEVETRTLRRIFKLRVVERAEEARRSVVVPAVRTKRRARKAARTVPPVVPEVKATQSAEAAPEGLPMMPVMEKYAASLPASVPEGSAPPQMHAGHDVPAGPATERTATAAGSPGPELAVHAVVSLGFTALHATGYEPGIARQAHHALGMRVTGAPRSAWWALEADVSGEWLAGPMLYYLEQEAAAAQLEVSGPWLRAEVGMRARIGTKWIPSAYARIGAQAHLIQTEKTRMTAEGDEVSYARDMRYGAVLALGMGLQYRAGDVLLGLDFQMRQGGPADYRSVAALWTVGCFLDQGE